MATKGNVTKIYELSSLGYSDLMKELNNINTAFATIKKTKQDLNNQKSQIEDPGQLADLKKKLQELAIEEANLRVQKKELTNESKAQQIQRQAEINQRVQEKRSVDDAATSYNALLKEYKELYKTIKAAPEGSNVDFRGQTLGFDQAIAKLKQLAAAEQDFRRQFTKDGLLVGEYTTGIVNAFKNAGLGDLIGGQLTKANTKLTELNQNFEVLKKELSEVGVNGQGSLEALEKQLIDNRKEALALQQQVGALQTEFRGTGDIGNQITTSLANGFKEVKNQIGQMVISYLGFQAAFNGVIAGIDNAKELSDQTTNLEVELGKAAGGASNLVAELSKLDTRTKLSGLEDIANIAAKAGVSEKDLVGVTQAIDKIKVAFGKDFGDVEEGTESLVKLINIFEGEGNVTGDNLLKTGNAIRTLANESVASVPFLNDFAKRMAGLKGISDISLPSVLGLASGFEQFGQNAEVASTSLVKIIPKLASDTEKYAKVAGLTKQAFADLLNSNPAESLIKVSQGLVQGKGSIEEISTAFADSELGSGRIASVLGVVGKNADAFRNSIASAGRSFNDTANIETAFTAKNENLAASLDKIGKKFADAANNQAFKATLTALSAVVLFLLTNMPTLLVLLGLLAVNWAVQNQALILLNLQLLGYNLAIGASYVALGLLTVVQGAYNAVTFITTNALNLATRALAFFGITLKATSGPLGVIITALGILATAYAAFGEKLTSATLKISDNIRIQRATIEVNKAANQSIVEQITKLDSWIIVVKSAAASADTKLKAMQALIAINPAFRDAMNGQIIDLQKLDAAYQKVTESIRLQAQVQAASGLAAEKQKSVLQVSTLRQQIETEFARQKGGNGIININDLTKDEKDILTGGLFGGSITDAAKSLRDTGKGVQFLKADFDKLIGQLKVIEDERIQTYEDYLTVSEQKRQQLEDLQKKIADQSAANANGAKKTFEVDIQMLKDQIKALDDQINGYQGSQKQLNDILAKRKALQAQLDKALGNQAAASNRGSRLTGEQKDAFKDIDAIRDQQLAEEKIQREQNKIDEETYLRDILRINQEAIDKKLALLKGANAEERKQIAQLQLERITSEMDTNQKIFDLREKALKLQLDNRVSNANSTARGVTDTPGTTDSQRVQARLDADKEILAAQIQYAEALDKLEKLTGQESVKNEQEAGQAIKKTKQDILKDNLDLTKASLADTKAAGERAVAEFKAIIAAQRNSISQSTKSPDQKARANDKLDKVENVGILANEVSSMQIQLPKYQQLLKTKQISDTEYNDFLAALNEKEIALRDAMIANMEKVGAKFTDFKSLVQSSLRDLFNVKTGSATDQAFGQALTSVYQTATDVMNNYFDGEKARIDENLQLQLERIDLEKAQAEARAESSAQMASIDKQAAKKAKDAQQQAFEQTKKVKREEAKIQLATELGGIWSSVWSIGNPIAAAILGVVLSGLAVLRYSSNVNQINSAKFAYGGNIGGMPSSGGMIGGRSHSQGGTPFAFNGANYEAEAGEMSIIRTKNAPQNQLFNIIGTQTQIASAINQVGGGVGFAPGASISRFDYGGSLGETLQAPIFKPSATGANVAAANEFGADVLNTMAQQANAIAEQSKSIQAISNRIDRLQVVQDTSTVTNAQKKQVQQSQVGTL